jgi:phenylacetate-CoA ligase
VVDRDRLVELVAQLRRSGSAYWTDKLAGVGEVTSVQDLPFTEKDEFRQQYPFGLLAVPMRDVVRLHASSGTSGKPTIVAYTAGDIDVFAEINARALEYGGATADDVVHVAYGYGLFTGGLGLHYGVERLGATAVPASGGNVALQLQLLVDLGARVLCCTPSFALLLAERAAELDLRGLRVRYGVFGAEPWSESMRTELEAAWSALTGQPFDACDIYGLSEVMGPGVAMECVAGKGALHVMDDHFVPEVVDPATGIRVDDGVEGELVLTTLTKQAMPVLRYRTKDLTHIVAEPCPCGRPGVRIARFTGRVDDMLVIRGVNVFPSQIERVLLVDDALGPQYAIVIDRRPSMAELEVRVELRAAGDEPTKAAVGRRVEEALATTLRVRTRVAVHDPGVIPRQEVGKAKRVFELLSDADPLGRER